VPLLYLASTTTKVSPQTAMMSGRTDDPRAHRTQAIPREGLVLHPGRSLRKPGRPTVQDTASSDVS
jgi:hypothetical protein